MATLTVAPGAYADMLDFSDSNLFWGDQYFYDNLIEFVWTDYDFVKATGNIYYDSWDYLAGGNVNRLIEYIDGYKVYEVSGLNMEVFTFLSYVDNFDSVGLMSYAFRQSDILYGGSYADVLSGFNGDDTVYGGGGDDIVAGASGRDTLYGGAGYDSFLLIGRPGASNVDRIMDYNDRYDDIWLDASSYKLPLGDLNKKYFCVGKKAKDKNDRIVYNKKTGELYYDENGKKKGGVYKMADIDKNLSLDAGDFLVVL